MAFDVLRDSLPALCCVSIPVRGFPNSLIDFAMRIAIRLQAFGLVLALLALPLAIVAGAYACAPQSCSMLCCAAHHGHSMNGMHMNCSGSNSKASICIVKCNSQSAPDFSLVAPLPPTQLSWAPNLPAPDQAEALWTFIPAQISAGFSLLPLQPPRS